MAKQLKFRSKIKTEKVPSGAVHFMEEGLDSQCSVKFEEKDGNKIPKLNMVIYSGGIIKGHWYWGNLAIDLSGIQFPKKRYPILAQHNIERKIAHTGKPIVAENLSVDPEKTKFVRTDDSEKFLGLVEDEFPFQSSMWIPPTSVERVAEGETAEVNGYKLKGPGSIFRKSIFKEASVCVFGADSDTSASAFSKDNHTEEIEYLEEGGQTSEKDSTKLKKEVKNLKNIAEFKEKYPDLFKEMEDAAKAKFKKELDLATATNTQLQETVTEQTTQLESQGNSIAELEKDKTIRDRQTFQDKIDVNAEKIFDAKFEESDVPDDLKSKVSDMPCLATAKFVNDGKFDSEAFGKACENELKDWEEKGATTVMGSTFASKGTETGETKKAADKLKESNDAGDDLLALAGQPQNTD